jgi:hypothetical protein
MKGRNLFIEKTEKGMYSYLEGPIFKLEQLFIMIPIRGVDRTGKP